MDRWVDEIYLMGEQVSMNVHQKEILFATASARYGSFSVSPVILVMMTAYLLLPDLDLASKYHNTNERVMIWAALMLEKMFHGDEGIFYPITLQKCFDVK